MNRRELVAILIEDHEYSAPALLESLVAALGDKEIFEALEYISRVEDWRHRIDARGNITDCEPETKEQKS